MFGGVPSVARLVDTPEAHALDADVAAAEGAAVAASRAVADPAAEARARAAVDARALAQAAAAAAGFAAFTGHLAAAADAGRQAELAERAAAALKEAEAAGEEGRVDDAQRLMEEAEQLKRVAATPTAIKLPGMELVRCACGGVFGGSRLRCAFSVRFRVFVLFGFGARGKAARPVGGCMRGVRRAGSSTAAARRAAPPPAQHSGTARTATAPLRGEGVAPLDQHARTQRPRGDTQRAFECEGRFDSTNTTKTTLMHQSVFNHVRGGVRVML
jgi:colicin import membrane protein